MEGVQNPQAQANNNTDPQNPQVEPQVQNQEPGRLAQQAGTEPGTGSAEPARCTGSIRFHIGIARRRNLR